MVDRRYLLDQPPAATGLRAVINQRVVPALVDIAGGVEVRLETVAETIRRKPAKSLLLAVGVGYLLARMGQPRNT